MRREFGPRFTADMRIIDFLQQLGEVGPDILIRHGFDRDSLDDRLSQYQALKTAARSGQLRDLDRLLAAVNNPPPTVPRWASDIAPLLPPYIWVWEAWVHRRVERFAFLDEYRLKVTVTMELTVPETSLHDQSTGARTTVIPIDYLSKAETVREFAMSIDGTQPLANLTGQESAMLGYSALLSRVSGSRRNSPRTRSQFWELVNSNPTTAAAARVALQARGAWFEDPEALQMAADLETSTVIYAVTDWVPGTRRVLTYTREVPLPVPTSGPSTGRLARYFGWLPVPISLDIDGLGLARSYHAEVVAPSGAAIVLARLVTSRAAEAGIAPTSIASDREGIDVVHLRLPGSPVELAADLRLQMPLASRPTWRGIPASIDLQVQLTKDVIWPVVLIGIVVSGMLDMGSLAHLAGFHTRGDAPVAAAVGLTALFAAFLSVGGRHRLLNRVGLLYRDAPFVLVALAFVAGASLAIQSSTNLKVLDWLTLGLASTALTAIALIAHVRVGRRIADRK